MNLLFSITTHSIAPRLLITSVFVVVLFVFGVLPYALHAQTAMTGGGYTLQGSLTVFNEVPAQATYTLAPVGDAVASAQSTGASYSLLPSPFTQTQSASPSNNANVLSQENAGRVTFGFIQTSTTSTVHSQIDPTVDISKGTVWFDTGNIRELERAIQKESTADANTVDTNLVSNPQELVIQGQSIYFNSEHKLIIGFLLILICFSRVFYWSSAQKKYITSRMPVFIFVDDILALHKGVDMSHVSVIARVTNKGVGILGLFIGNIVVSGLILISAWLLWGISHALAVVLVFTALYRLYIGYRLSR